MKKAHNKIFRFQTLVQKSTQTAHSFSVNVAQENTDINLRHRTFSGESYSPPCPGTGCQDVCVRDGGDTGRENSLWGSTHSTDVPHSTVTECCNRNWKATGQEINKKTLNKHLLENCHDLKKKKDFLYIKMYGIVYKVMGNVRRVTQRTGSDRMGLQLSKFTTSIFWIWPSAAFSSKNRCF